MVKSSVVFALLAIIALICSFFCSPDWSTRLSSISTIMSIVLGSMSIVYSYHCNKQTDELLKKIEQEFENVARDAQTNLINKNMGRENHKIVTEMINQRSRNNQILPTIVDSEEKDKSPAD